MAGIITEPMAEASATADPVMPAKTMHEKIVAWASPPRIRPTIRSAKRRSPLVISPRSIRSPPRMKRGMARRGKASVPMNIFWGITTSGIPCMTRTPPRAVTPMASATGMPEIIVRTNNPVIVWSTMEAGSSYNSSGTVDNGAIGVPCHSRQSSMTSTQISITAETGIAAYGMAMVMPREGDTWSSC